MGFVLAVFCFMLDGLSVLLIRKLRLRVVAGKWSFIGFFVIIERIKYG